MSNSNAGLLKLKAFDPSHLGFYVNNERIYGYSLLDRKVLGDEDNFTIKLQFTSDWNNILKQYLDTVVKVECRYGDQLEGFQVCFIKEMKVTKHKIVFDEFIPSIFVTFEVNK